MTTSLFRRVTVALTITAGLSAALVVALLGAYETRSARADLARDVDASVSAFARLVEPALWDVDLDRAGRLATAFARDPRIARLGVREGTTGTGLTVEPVRTADTARRVMEVRREDERLGEVEVAFDRGYYRRQVRRQLVNAVVVSLIALGVTLVGLRVLHHRLFRRPLDELSDVVRAYASPDPPPFATAVPYVEFADLGRVLDSMSAQIRDQLRALSAANRELGALNRLLVVAADDVQPAEVVAEAARELRALFGATRVRADVDGEVGGGPARTVYAHADDAREDAVAAIAVPIVVNSRPIGTISLAREPDRPFAPAEVALANTIAAQVALAISRYRARAAERLLRAAIEQLPESVIVTDPQRRIVYVNPGFTAITGYSAAEVIGREPRAIERRDGDADPPIEDALHSAIDGGQSWIGRITSVKKSGEVFFEELVVTPVRDETGAITNHVAIGRDVTADMRRDEQYRHAQRMDAVGQLAGGVAHDFNNMLGAVLMQMELLALDEQLTPPVQHALREMRTTLERAANLTRQLLAFSRRQAMRVAPHDLNAIVAEMLRLLTRIIGERIAVEFVRAPAAVTFEGDAGMIEQVIVNLCVNARDAMPTGGRLVLATDTVTFGAGAEHPGTWARLDVRDTGSGIPPEVRTRIFEPFFTTKEVGKGTGLGLATSHGIVAQHGGWIDVDTAVGEGSTFHVYLPALVVAPSPSLTPPLGVPTHGAARRHATVLLVEDEPLVRQTVSTSLRRLGHRILEATDGQDALRLWEERGDGVDLVITDMVMPGGVSGVQLVERMRETNPALRAIVMSGYSLQLSSDALPPGISFLAKPFRLAALGSAIDDALGRPAG